MNDTSRSLRLLCEEPFRIFFPTGLFLGIIGVSLWPLFYWGAGIPYPNVSHARLMIEGFMGSFVLGFLGTAGPRMLSVAPLTPRIIGPLFTLNLLAAGFHAAEAHRAGDLCFVACLSLFAGAGANRFLKRSDSPPPNFALVMLGIVSGIVGAGLVAFSEAAQFSRSYQFGSALLNQGFILLPVLGVSPFFLGRLLELPQPDLPESRAFPPDWLRQAAFAALIGMVIIASLWIDIVNLPRLGAWVRVVTVTLYLLTRLPFRGHNFLANCLRLGIFSIVLGLIVATFLPDYRVGAWHIIFITGFSFMVFTVAIRVIFGHSGNISLIRKRLPFFIVSAVLIYVAMLSRVSADLAPRARIIHLLAAAVCWLLASLIWMAKVIPKITAIEPEN